jgi:anhydro-N-acetylmuramic acid kinase
MIDQVQIESQNMNPSIKKLATLSSSKSRIILGLMSGTSLDGLDMALCRFSGSGMQTKAELLHFATAGYNEEISNGLRQITSVEQAQMKEVTYWHTQLARVHAGMILDQLKEWNVAANEVDCIASHGQTIYHYPSRDQKRSSPVNSTLQIGDGDQIAVQTGILTISDFRQKHVAHGGEGAPMAGLADLVLFSHPHESRILLNIGGIANYTWLPARELVGEESFTTDTGPGNTLIDNLADYCFEEPFDRDGKIAFSGKVHKQLLTELMQDPWFDDNRPKTTGPEYFNRPWLFRRASEAGLDPESMNPADLIATASELTVQTVANSIRKQLPKNVNPILYVSGGGAHNAYVMKRLQEELSPMRVRDFGVLGTSADAKEAVIFALLANETLAGEGFRWTLGEKSKVHFGKISFPV